MNFDKIFTWVPPAEPENPAPKKEKPADPKKEAMRAFAGEIKGLEAEIGNFKDVDINSQEAPSQNEAQQVLTEIQKTETDKDSGVDVDLNNKEAEVSKEIQEELKEIDALEKSISNISVIVGGLRKRIVFWQSDDVIDLRDELPILKAKVRHFRLEMADRIVRNKEILQVLKKIYELEDQFRKNGGPDDVLSLISEDKLSESDIKIESAKKRKRRELKK